MRGCVLVYLEYGGVLVVLSGVCSLYGCAVNAAVAAVYQIDRMLPLSECVFLFESGGLDVCSLLHGVTLVAVSVSRDPVALIHHHLYAC